MERKTKYALPWIIYLGSLMGFGLAKFILRGIGVEFRMWVQALLWALAFLFPALLIGYYLTRIKYKVVAVVLTVIYAVLAVNLLRSMILVPVCSVWKNRQAEIRQIIHTGTRYLFLEGNNLSGTRRGISSCWRRNITCSLRKDPGHI